jgi:hypothetical protein
MIDIESLVSSPARTSAVGVGQSLKRNKTDRLDVVQIRASPSRQSLQAQGALDALV